MAKKKVPNLPKVIHVRREEPENDEDYLIASEDGIYGAMDGDGPDFVGEYHLVKVVKAKRVVQFDEV